MTEVRRPARGTRTSTPASRAKLSDAAKSGKTRANESPRSRAVAATRSKLAEVAAEAEANAEKTAAAQVAAAKIITPAAPTAEPSLKHSPSPADEDSVSAAVRLMNEPPEILPPLPEAPAHWSESDLPADRFLDRDLSRFAAVHAGVFSVSGWTAAGPHVMARLS